MRETLIWACAMEFACSHVVCNWATDEVSAPGRGLSRVPSVSDHPYDNRLAFTPQPTMGFLAPPPVPPRTHPSSSSTPPPLPPRAESERTGSEAPSLRACVSEAAPPRANINVVSLKVGSLADISKASAVHCSQKPVHCGKCSAVMSSVSSSRTQQNITTWSCEFCGQENVFTISDLKRGGFAVRTPPGRDIIYREEEQGAEYENLDDMLIVLCVDTSGSMSVTSEISAGNSTRSATYVSRLQEVQEALQMVMTSLMKTAAHRRVALVTFNNEVTVYGDGTAAPLTLRDCALLDYDFLRKQGEEYDTPHCITEAAQPLTRKIKELREHGATALGPAALVSVAMASRFAGSKVIICTDGLANIGLGQLEQESPHCPAPSPYFYNQLANYAADKGVIVSVMTFEGEDCRLAEVGRLADHTGGRINTVKVGTVAAEIQSAIADNIIATSVMATLLAPEGVVFPYEEAEHRLVREMGNVTDGAEITFQFSVRAEHRQSFLSRDRVPFQLQLRFRTRDLQRVTRVITQQKRVTTSSWVWPGSLNMSVLGVHCAQLCARLTMEGRLQEAQLQLHAQQQLLRDVSKQKPNPAEESVYGNWISTMSSICDDLSATQSSAHAPAARRPVSSSSLSDAAAKLVYQMKRASSQKSLS